MHKGARRCPGLALTLQAGKRAHVYISPKLGAPGRFLEKAGSRPAAHAAGASCASAGAIDAKRQIAENLRGRFDSCKTGLPLARGLRDVAVREPITKNSGDLPEPFRDLLAKLEVGRLSSPDVTPQGLQMYALCEKKESTADSQAKREIREKIFATRYETEAKKFLDEIYF